MKTEEWTPLEPGVIDHKFYVRGIGTVKEAAVKGGDEHLELVSVQGDREPLTRGGRRALDRVGHRDLGLEPPSGATRIAPSPVA